MDESNPLGDRRIYGLQVGVVADRVDPMGLGRVRIRILGIHEPMGPWAFPLGTDGGSANQGRFVVPQQGAEVGVFFKDGDPDHPYYVAGNWGAPGGMRETPTPVKDLAPEDVPLVAAFEFGRYMIAVDTREASSGWTVTDKTSGDTVEYDGKKMGLRIKSTIGILLEADGQIDLKANLVTINGRVVLDTDRGI